VLEEFPNEHPMRQSILAITELGQGLLKCENNWLTINKKNIHAERSVGGVRIEVGKNNWHWSTEHNRPVMM